MGRQRIPKKKKRVRRVRKTRDPQEEKLTVNQQHLLMLKRRSNQNRLQHNSRQPQLPHQKKLMSTRGKTQFFPVENLRLLYHLQKEFLGQDHSRRQTETACSHLTVLRIFLKVKVSQKLLSFNKL